MLVLLEVKDPAQPASKRRLTGAEAAFHALFHAYPVFVVTSLSEALRALGEG